MQPATKQERTIVFLMAIVQFVNVLDFMMVSPLGPDFAKNLAIPVSRLALVGGSYTASAAVTGLVGSFFLDRFDRKKALLITLLGLAGGTFLGGFATGLGSLLLARVVAGAFGGPATSLAIAIVADAIPSERRGWAMGIVMGGFAAASILGVPAGLLLAEWGGWRLPFFGVAGVMLLVTAFATYALPTLKGHLQSREDAEHPVRALRQLLAKPTVVASLAMTGCAMMGSFVLILNIPAFVQYNLGFPRSQLDRLYLFGGAASFLTMRIVGPLVDRFGSTIIAAVGTIALMGITWVGFIDASPNLSVLWLFIGFFIAMAFRNVAYNTLTSKVPEASERARFLSIQSAVQHAASAAAAGVSTQILSELPSKQLVHMERVAFISMTLVALVPLLMLTVERLVRGRLAMESSPVSVRPSDG